MSSFEPTPQRIYRPLISMVTALVIGIAAGVWRPGQFGVALAAALITSLALCIQICRHRWAAIWPVMLCVWGGYLSIQPWLDPVLPDHHLFHFVDKGYWRIHGVVADTPQMKRGRWKFELDASRIVNEEGSHDVCGRAVVTGRGKWPGAKSGDGVVFRGRLRSIRNFSNPGGFDYARFMMLKGIRARVYASARSLKIETVSSSGTAHQRIETMRKKLSARMDVVLGEYEIDTRSLLKALILGDRSGISASLRDDFNRTGVGHVLAISGLHVGMVATVSFALARWLLACIPLMLKMAWVRKVAALISLGPILGYGLLAGLSPSTQRALLMVSVFLLGIWVGRRHDWLNTLALAALAILTIYPPALLSISFQLSFLAVLAIVIGSKRLPGSDITPESSIWEKVRRRLMAFVWVSAMAILGTLPIVLHYFNQVSLIGLVTNLFVVPLVGLWVVPAGLLGTLAGSAILEFTSVFWHTAAFGAQLMLWVVQYASAWPWAAVHCVTPNGLEIGLYYLLAAAVVLRKKWPYGGVAVTVISALCMADVGYWIYQRHGRNALRVTAIDVGQASANLIELPQGGTMLVDGGGFSDNSSFDVGAVIVAPLLWRKKIKTIDLMVLSHANSDHLNGLLYILSHFNVVQVWSNHEPAPSKGYRQWARLLAERKVQHETFDQMATDVVREGVRMEILAPPADFIQRKAAEPWRDLNNNSLVLRICYGDISFLFTGDIMKDAEADLLARTGGNGLQSTVLLVPHHGSRSSSTMDFIRAVAPTEAVISAGWQNRFNFPHPVVLQRLQTVGSRIWCTADNGAVEITSDGKIYAVRTFRPGAP